MIDIVVVALSGLSAGIAIGAGPALIYRGARDAARAERDAERATADLLRQRLAQSMVNAAGWKSRALSQEWDALGIVAPRRSPPSNVVSLCRRRAAGVVAVLPDRSA